MKIYERTVEVTLKTLETTKGYINNRLLIHTVSPDRKINLRFSLRLLFEILGSFTMILLLLLPAVFGVQSSSNSALKYISNNNWLSAFYISITISITFLISSKVGVASSGLSIAYQLYKGSLSYPRAWVVWFHQVLGAFAATFLIWSLAMNEGLFYKNGEIVDGAVSVGSSLGTPTPFIKGILTKYNGPGYTPELWMYILQSVVAFIFVVTIFFLYRLSYQINGKQEALWTLTFKLMFSFVMIYGASTIFAHITNPSRIIVPALVARWMGGMQNTTSAWTLVITTILAYHFAIMLPANSRVNWKRWFRPGEYHKTTQRDLIDININKKTEEY